MIELEQIKKNVTADINEHVEYLCDYFVHSDMPNKQSLIYLFNKKRTTIESLVGDLAVLYYSVAFSYDSNLYKNIKNDIVNIVRQEPILINIINIYSELIEIKDINKHLSEKSLTEKQRELTDFYQFIEHIND